MRVGEARNPGPDVQYTSLQIGTTNPTGLRGKESLLMEAGEGIWHLSETQLSQATQASTRRAFRSLGTACNRRVRPIFGAPAEVRTNSRWAGSWTGVLIASDFPSQQLTLPWPDGVYETGRVTTALHMVCGLPLLSAAVYGYPKSAAHPRARDQTDALLQTLTTELVLGRSGPRIICGDLNHDQHVLSELDVWRSRGWVEAQTLASERWMQAPTPTCKGVTHRDFLFLSPEAAALCHRVQVLDHFQEHSTVVASLRVPAQAQVLHAWPRPSLVPWTDVDIQAWQAGGSHAPVEARDPTEWFQAFSSAWETSLDGFVSEAPSCRLPQACHGRARRLKPQTRPEVSRIPRASRPSEVTLQNDLCGAEVKRWFQQLRRLQSLSHALAAGKTTPAAVHYRSSLWGAILGAKGFQGGFAHWWHTRPLQAQGAPVSLPAAPPSAAAGEEIFQDFRSNFRKFEAWHLGQRAKVIRSRYDASRLAVLRDLRDDPPEQVDVLTQCRAYTVEQVDYASQTVTLHSAVDLRGTSTWSLLGEPVVVEPWSSRVLRIQGEVVLHVGQELEQRQTLTEVAHIHEEFVRLWQPRWSKHEFPDPSCWDRVLQFTRAHLPAGGFQLPVITREDWLAAVRRFRPQAARGPDGYAKLDLLHMPPARVDQLLSFLARIEAGQCEWPDQLLVGFVIGLAKDNGREGVDGYRPICVTSVIYRAWSSIRARQLLGVFQGLMVHEAFGFMPQREASELWYPLQAAIETACQGGDDLLGLSTDVGKAFNNLPRRPVFAIAQHLGIPENLLIPWQGFSRGLTRRFMIRGSVSCGLASTTGFAEGCPLSTVAMSIASLVFHRYLQVFAPSIRSLSFVDNLSCTTGSVGQLASGLNLVRCFAELLDLELDEAKTFVWAVQPASRRAARALGVRVATAARELGGVVTFGSAPRNAEMVARLRALKPVWDALHRSRCPKGLKFDVLPMKLWPRALHGIAGCLLGEHHLQGLRAQAARAIGVNHAGANPAVRLSLCRRMECDPGFFQLWVTLRDLRRLSRKQPSLVAMWRAFMANFDGRLYPGPFSKLLEVFSQLGWRVEVPPRVTDHRGFSHDLLAMPVALLRRIAEAAWLNHVGLKASTRPSMQGAGDLDVQATRRLEAGLSEVDCLRLGSLRSGAHLSPAQQCKFDASQSGVCPHCHVPDTMEHRVRSCPVFAFARLGHDAACDQWASLQPCLANHLLFPANPFAPKLQRLLDALPDLSGDFMPVRLKAGAQDLFTDGSCFSADVSDLALAAWGVVHGMELQPLACGPVPGLLQTIARGELWAVISAARWHLQTRQAVRIWTDSLTVVRGAQHLLDTGGLGTIKENLDLWAILADIFQQADPGGILIAHVPSHLDPAQCDSDFEEWAARGNHAADTLAVTTNQNRSQEVKEAHSRAQAWYQAMWRTATSLRAVYLAIAEHTGNRQPGVEDDEEIVEVVVPIPPCQEQPDRLSDCVALGWRASTEAVSQVLPFSVTVHVFEWVLRLDVQGSHVCTISWLELAVMLFLDPDQSVPALDASGRWTLADPLFPSPRGRYVASLYSLIRTVIRKQVSKFHLEQFVQARVDLTELGVFFPMGGLVCGVSAGLLQSARQRIRDYASTKGLRRVGDLLIAF